MSQRCGCVYVEARHTAAPRARDGANLYVVVETAFGTRAIVGEVHGPASVAPDLAAAIEVAFGELARHEPQLSGLARRLNAFVADQAGRRDPSPGDSWVPGAGPGQAGGPGASFAAASLVQVGALGDTAEFLVFSHTVPLVMRADGVRQAPVLDVDPLLGLWPPVVDRCSPTSVNIRVGDALLLYTRSVTETRDALGERFPLEQRAAALRGEAPQVLLARLESELLAHGGGRTGDETTLLLLRAEEPGFLGYALGESAPQRTSRRSRLR
ncbi:PP2C family protein-serine/threonine phosphatase [Nonomuraea zeae]|nr:SpoIIE family protein phosphatase [Nonomuraea zeae]